MTETIHATPQFCLPEFTTFLPNHPKWAVYSNTWFEGLQAVEAGEMTAAEAVDFVTGLMEDRLGDTVIIR